MRPVRIAFSVIFIALIAALIRCHRGAHRSDKATHDSLTGLYNRAGYDLLLSGLDMKTTSLLLIDADNFKSVNDTYGHEMGDRALYETKKRGKRGYTFYAAG